MSRDVVRTKTRDGVLSRPVLHSPVDDSVAKTRRRIFWIVVLLAVAIIAIVLIRRFTIDRPVDYRAEVDHFKYGSIGSEPGGSLRLAIGGLLPPYEIFKVLPQVCPDKLPGGYASLGLIFEKGHDLPIGVSRRRRLGLDQVGLNCAVCHTGTVRESRNDTRHDRRRHAGAPAESAEPLPIRARLLARRALHAGQCARSHAGGGCGSRAGSTVPPTNIR